MRGVGVNNWEENKNKHRKKEKIQNPSRSKPTRFGCCCCASFCPCLTNHQDVTLELLLMCLVPSPWIKNVEPESTHSWASHREQRVRWEVRNRNEINKRKRRLWRRTQKSERGGRASEMCAVKRKSRDEKEKNCGFFSLKIHCSLRSCFQFSSSSFFSLPVSCACVLWITFHITKSHSFSLCRWAGRPRFSL